MARPKKIYQTPVIERIEKPVDSSVKTVQVNPAPILIPKDDTVLMRRLPTMEPKHVIAHLKAGVEYNIRKIVHSAVYGDFYLLDNGFYIAKVGNITVKE